MEIVKGAEPIFLEGGEQACLLIHGLTGSPSEMGYLAGRLHAAGYTVRAPLLPGHGTPSIKDVNRTTWHAWLGAVTREFYGLADSGRPVYVAGLSLGGLLALSLLALFGNRIRAGAVLSTPMRFKSLQARVLLPLVARSPIIRFIQDVPKPQGMDVREEQGPRHVCNERDSLSAAYSTKELMNVVRRKSFLARIDRPLLIIQSRLDTVIHPGSAAHIYRSVASPAKELVMLDESYHTITVDKERDRVAREIIGFFNRHT